MAASSQPVPASQSPSTGIGGALSGFVARRAAAATLEERDPTYIERALPPLWAFLSVWFRPEIHGLDRIPAEGPVLLVGNHSGGNVAPDTLVFTLAFIRHFGVQRPFFQLAHDLVAASPAHASLHRFGTVAASHGNAHRALELGAALLVYPGGDWEVHRPVWQGHRVEFHGRDGFVRLALHEHVPIVPVVSIGGQETALFITRGERLAHVTRVDQLFHLHALPVSIALPWGLNVGDLMGHVPLPAKVTIEVLDPIDLDERYGPAPDVSTIYDDVVELMQHALDDLAARRHWPILG